MPPASASAFEALADPGAEAGASPTRKAFHGTWVAKTGARVETEPFMSPTRPGWMICSTKRRLAPSSSACRASPGRRRSSIPAAAVLVLQLGLGEIAQQPADGGIRRLLGGGFPVEARGVLLHLSRMRTHRLDAQSPHLPEWLALHPAAHVLTPDQRYVRAETLREQVDEPAAVLVLLGRHVGEDPRALSGCSSPSSWAKSA